jgi:hypothetical protein
MLRNVVAFDIVLAFDVVAIMVVHVCYLAIVVALVLLRARRLRNVLPLNAFKCGNQVYDERHITKS